MMTDYLGAPVPFDPEDPEGPDLPQVSALTVRSGGPMYRARKALRGSLEVLTEARDTLRVDLQTAVRRWRDQQEVTEALQSITTPSRAQREVAAADLRTEPRGGVL
jgi:hypothetical protein